MTTNKHITCTTMSHPPVPGHPHIIGVGLSHGARETVATVRQNITAGEVYHTGTGSSIAVVQKYDCWCGVKTIASAPNATPANDLDHVPPCP